MFARSLTIQDSSVKMHPQRFLVLFALLAALSLCEGHMGGRTKLQDLNPQIYCGRNLARVLAALCNDDFEKRSDSSGTMYNTILSAYDKEPEVAEWPWMTRPKPRELGRGKRIIGIVSECCEKACSVNDLLSYC